MYNVLFLRRRTLKNELSGMFFISKSHLSKVSAFIFLKLAQSKLTLLSLLEVSMAINSKPRYISKSLSEIEKSIGISSLFTLCFLQSERIS